MSIIPLISSWEQYILTHPSGDLQDFGRWLQVNPVSNKPNSPDTLTEARMALSTKTNLDPSSIAGLLVNRLNNINHFFAKPVIRKLGINDGEFSILVQVYLIDKLNKKELCSKLLIENSTGVEITRRLAKKGLLRESVDPNDRRSARLSLTEKGQRLLKEGYAKLVTTHTSFLAPLPADQQQQLVNLLTRLNDYHSARLPDAAKTT
jgi:DNA-binding MarR family transcriptional regulator